MSDKTLKIRIKLQPAETSTVSLDSPPKVYKEEIEKSTHNKSKKRWHLASAFILSGLVVSLATGYLIFSGEEAKTSLTKLPIVNSDVSANQQSIQTEIETKTTTDKPSIVTLADASDPIHFKSKLTEYPQKEPSENTHKTVSEEKISQKVDPKLETVSTVTVFDSPDSGMDMNDANPLHEKTEISTSIDDKKLSIPIAADFSTTSNQERLEAHGNNKSLSHTDLNSSSSAASLTTHVARAQFTTGIKNREPIDHIEDHMRSEEQTSRRLFYFTDLRDLKGEKVTHRWKYKGNTMAKVNFKVGGARWRVYSSKNLTSSLKGEWQIVVTDSADRVLLTDTITYD